MPPPVTRRGTCIHTHAHARRCVGKKSLLSLFFLLLLTPVYPESPAGCGAAVSTFDPAELRPPEPPRPTPCWDPQCTSLSGLSHCSFLLLSISRPAAAARRPSMLSAGRTARRTTTIATDVDAHFLFTEKKHSFLLPMRAVLILFLLANTREKVCSRML